MRLDTLRGVAGVRPIPSYGSFYERAWRRLVTHVHWISPQQNTIVAGSVRRDGWGDRACLEVGISLLYLVARELLIPDLLIQPLYSLV